MWIANFKEQWRVYSIKPVGRVVNVTPNTNKTTTITFSQRHGLSKLDPVSFINVAPNVNGYYLVTRINDLSSITINLSLEEQINLLTEEQINLKIWLLDQIRLYEEGKLNTYQKDKLLNFIEERRTHPIILEVFNILQSI